MKRANSKIKEVLMEANMDSDKYSAFVDLWIFTLGLPNYNVRTGVRYDNNDTCQIIKNENGKEKYILVAYDSFVDNEPLYRVYDKVQMLQENDTSTKQVQSIEHVVSLLYEDGVLFFPKFITFSQLKTVILSM